MLHKGAQTNTQLDRKLTFTLGLGHRLSVRLGWLFLLWTI